MHRITATLAAALTLAALALAAPAQAYQHLQVCRENLDGRRGDDDVTRWVRERTPTGVIFGRVGTSYLRYDHRLQPQMAVQINMYKFGSVLWGYVPGYCVGHDANIVDHAGRVPYSWLGVIPDPVRYLRGANARNERPSARVSARAETPAQFDVAEARVIREAAKLQRANRYRQGRKRITPEARYYVWGTTQTGPEVTLRWRIRVKTKPQQGTAGWLVCKGRVTVRGEPTTDPSALRAALATDSCIA